MDVANQGADKDAPEHVAPSPGRLDGRSGCNGRHRTRGFADAGKITATRGGKTKTVTAKLPKSGLPRTIILE